MKTVIQLVIMFVCICLAIGCALTYNPDTDSMGVEFSMTPAEVKELYEMVFNTRAVGEIRFQTESGHTIVISKPVSCDDDDDSEPMDEDVDTKAFG